MRIRVKYGLYTVLCTPLLACSDVTSPSEVIRIDLELAHDHNSTGTFTCQWDDPGTSFCNDRELLDWERDFLAEFADGLCADGRERIKQYLAMNLVRFRTDSDAPPGDWHWGDGIHLNDNIFDRGHDAIYRTLAHEAGHDNCDCNDEITAEQYADSCVVQS